MLMLFIYNNIFSLQFLCQICKHRNCMACKAIHEGMNCQEYQENLKIVTFNDEAERRTQIMLEVKKL